MSLSKTNKKAASVRALLGDPDAPLEHRYMVLRTLVNDGSPQARELVAELLQLLASTDAESVYEEKRRELAELLREMNEGPRRSGFFLHRVTVDGAPTRQACVLLEDGTRVFTTIADETLAGVLRCGDSVIVEGRGRALLARAPEWGDTGEVAVFERKLDDRRVEVTLRGQERAVFHASATLSEKLRADAVAPGAALIVHSRLGLAFDAIPPADGLAHYRYLVREPVPDVVAERDIGACPKFIDELTDLVRIEMTQPDLRRRFKLRRCCMKLLTGVSGTGKTLSIHAFWRRMYDVMSEVTGVPRDQLPPRVFRLRLSETLSMWLGQSDQNLALFFREVLQRAGELFTCPDGRRVQLPLLVIMEEIDGIAHARGTDPIFDRLLSGVLQLMDPNRPDLQDKLILFIGTTNEPGQVDRAFLRRIGGSVEKFGRLNRSGFVSVLQKHLQGLPLAANNGDAPEELQRRLIRGLTDWLYSPNGADRGLVELTYVGATVPEVRHRRDFLTGAMIDRAVQQAADETVKDGYYDAQPAALTLHRLMKALDDQLRSVADQLNEHNVRHYLDLPDGVRVATVRRLPQPELLPTELQRQ